MKQLETVETAPEKEQEQPKREQTPERPRINPRLVFGNPDLFFSDLLMEQSEQG